MLWNYCLCFRDTSILKHKEENMYVISTLSDPQVFSLLNKSTVFLLNCSSDKFGALMYVESHVVAIVLH